MSWWSWISGSLQYLLVALVAGVAPVLGWRHVQELRAWTSAELRLSVIRAAVLQSWLVAAVACALVLPNSLFPVTASDTDMPWLLQATPHGHGLPWWLLVSASAALTAYALAPGLHCLLDGRARRRYDQSVKDYRFLAPVSRQERRWWLVVSLTAGVCEELLFRGFLLQFLRGASGSGLHFSLTSAWLVSALVFGAGHAYQGARKAAQSAAGGLVLGLAAILTGNLLLPMLLHALVDAQMLWLYRPSRDDPDEAQRLIEGCALT